MELDKMDNEISVMINESLKDALQIKDELIKHQTEIIENQGSVIAGLRSQWIVHYPVGATSVQFEDAEKEIDNSELAVIILEKLKMGKSITVPNTWNIVQSFQEEEEEEVLNPNTSEAQ